MKIGSCIGIGFAQNPLLPNKFLAPDDFTSASWAKTNIGTVTANVEGVADQVPDDTTAGQHRINQTPTGVFAGAATVSIEVKDVDLGWIWILTNNQAAERTWIDVATGAAGTTGTGHTLAIQPLGGGWYSCRIQFVYAAASIGIGLATANNGLSYTGTGESVLFRNARFTQP